MKNFKKVLALALALSMILSTMTTAFAANANDDKAVVLNQLGLFKGTSTTEFVPDLDKATDAAQALVLIGRALGWEVDAAATVTFTDVPDYAVPYVAYAVEKGITNGVSETEFGTAVISGKRMVTWFLAAAGYDKAAVWADTETYATETGMTVPAGTLRDDVVAVIYAGLMVKPVGSETTIVEDLVAADPTLEDAAVAAGLVDATPEVLEVVSVTAKNLKEVEVVFNKAVDKADAEKEANYKVFNGGASTDLLGAGTAVLQEDGVTVLLTLGTSFNNGTTGKVEVSNLLPAKYSNDSVAVSDSTIPTVVGIEVTGPQTFTVEYSEPITNLDAAEYTVDAGNYIVTSAVANGSKKVDVTVGVNFADGEHTVKFNASNVTDYAGYKVVPMTKAFTVAADAIAPTVTIKSVTPKQVKLVFDKPVKNVSDANVKYRHTFNNDTYSYAGDTADVDTNTAGNQPFITKVSSTEYTLDFSQKPIALGSNVLYIGYASASGTKVEDLWGNDLAEAALPLSVELDTVKPAVTNVEFVDSQTMKVTFTEEVDATTSQVASNYTVKDSAGDKVAVNTATLGGDDSNVVTLVFAADALTGGNYTVEVKNVKDIAFVPNTMDAYSTALAITDKVRPTVKATTWAATGAAAADYAVKLYVPFSEAMDVSTLVKSNFIVTVSDSNGAQAARALGSNDSITIAGDAKSVELKVDNPEDRPITGVALTVGAVKDVAGNGFAGIVSVSTTDFAIAADSVAVEKVEAIGTKKLKVTYSGRLSTVSATGYSLALDGDGSAVAMNMSVTSHTVNSSNKSEVEFSLGTALTEAAETTGSLDLVVNDATGTKSYLGTKVDNIASATTADANDILDKIAPTVASVVYTNATTITVTFNESIEADTIASTLNGFSIANGGVLDSVAITGGADATTIVLTAVNGTDKAFIQDVTTVSYNSVAGLTDVAGNAVASFTDKIAD